MEAIGTALMLIGMIIYVIGSIMYLFASFGVSVWWGLAVLFLPLAEIIFLFAHWEEAKSSFKVIMFGCLLLVASAFVVGVGAGI